MSLKDKEKIHINPFGKCYKEEDVKEAVLDYKKFYFSEELCIDEKIINDICIKYAIDVHNDSDLDIFQKIIGDFEEWVDV